MPSVALYNMNGENIGTIDLKEEIFAAEVNKAVLHEVVVNYLANQRQGTQSTKTRAEVSGGGRKPWRQKGTGNARHGSTRAPQWTHGGNAFANKPRSYRYSLNKKVKAVAMKSALSAKAQSSDIIVIDSINMDAIKTKDFSQFLKAIDVAGKALVVTSEMKENVVKSARNIPGVTTTFAGIMSPYEILNCKKFVIEQDALRRLEEVYA